MIAQTKKPVELTPVQTMAIAIAVLQIYAYAMVTTVLAIVGIQFLVSAMVTMVFAMVLAKSGRIPQSSAVTMETVIVGLLQSALVRLIMDNVAMPLAPPILATISPHHTKILLGAPYVRMRSLVLLLLAFCLFSVFVLALCIYIGIRELEEETTQSSAPMPRMSHPRMTENSSTFLNT